jgi:peptidoglycan/LPS O-acetylase OafA/YrhL
VTLRQSDSISTTEQLPDQRSAQTKFRPDIEGLRAIAVLAVVLFHAYMPGIGGGFVGVDVFFVISGFLITGLLWREVSSTGSVRLRSFYGARARRLLPAAGLVGVVTLIASVFLLPLGQARPVVFEGIASALYVSNMWSILVDVDYFNAAGHMAPSPFQHYWSLGVEEQFYLVWAPIILCTAWLIRRVHRQRKGDDGTATGGSRRPYLVVLGLVAILSFALSLVITFVMPAIAFFSLPTRAWQLALGGVVALTALQWQRLSPRAAAIAGWAGAAMIVTACTLLSAHTPYPGFAALLPTVGAALVIGAGCALPTQGVGRLLGTSPMRAIGRISYSWYLWHWPVLIFAPMVVGHQLGLAGRLTAALLSGVLAVLTLRFVENPLRFAAPIRTSAWRSLGVGAVASLMVVCVGVGFLKWMPSPVGRGEPIAPVNLRVAPAAVGSDLGSYDAAVDRAFAQMQAAVAASANLKDVPSNLQPSLADAPGQKNEMDFDGCVANFFEGGPHECTMGDTASPTTVALMGDSHAAMLVPAFQQIADERHWRLEVLSKAGCPALDVPITNVFARLTERFQRCKQWRDQAIAQLQADRPQLIVLSIWRQYSAGNWQAGFTPYDSAWFESVTRMVQRLRSTGAQVLLLGPVPDPHSVVPVCLSSHLDDAMACAPTRSSAVNQAGMLAEAAAAEAGGGQYAELTDLFCTTDRCPVIVGNTLAYLDWSHLTIEFSRLLAPALGALSDRALVHG